MMKTILAVLTAALCWFSAPAPSEGQGGRALPCGEHGTQAEANACARREHERADAEMGKVFERLMAELAEYGDEDRRKLRLAQEAWLRYRDATCESESSVYEGGSIRPAVYSACMASVTRERTKRLEEFLAAASGG